MSETIKSSSAPKSSLFSANPILRRVSKITERDLTNAATYKGIAVKTVYFLLAAMAGIIAYLLVKERLFAAEAPFMQFTIAKKFTVELCKTEAITLGAVAIVGLICQLVSVFSVKAVPFTGTIYCASEGWFIAFLVYKVLGSQPKFMILGLEALLITVAVVGVMSWLYTSGKVRMTPKFTLILMTLVLGTVALSVISLILYLIPGTRELMAGIRDNFALVVIFDLIAIVIAALFLISDFTMIDNCVKEGYPRQYEWSAAFGLAFTVIWLYLKILDLLIQIAGRSKN